MATAHHQRRNQLRRWGTTGAPAASSTFCTIVGRLFSFVVTLVVVGTCLFVATRIAIGQEPQADKPATPVRQRVRCGPVEDEVDVHHEVALPQDSTSPWRRVR